MAKESGFEVVDPPEADVLQFIEKETDDRLADVVFEVAGVQPMVDLMTQIASVRSRIVMVAIHCQAKNVNLFQFFWKVLKLIGAGVYKWEDYDEAIRLVTANELPFEKMIAKVEPLTIIQNVFENIVKNPDGMNELCIR